MSGWRTGLILMVTVIFCSALDPTLFNLSVSQDVYQAEEHSNITLMWLFPISAVSSTDSLIIDVLYVKPIGMIYHYDSKTETELYPHELYGGRVLCDLELARKGRIECIFTDLKLSDTGTYQCIVVAHKQSSYKTCSLNITAATDQREDETPKPESRGRICLYTGFSFLMLVVIALTGLYFIHQRASSI